MKFVSTRIITADVQRLVAFYETVTQTAAVWANELFAEVPTPVGTLAIGSDKTVPMFGAGSAEPGANRSAIIEFEGVLVLPVRTISGAMPTVMHGPG